MLLSPVAVISPVFVTVSGPPLVVVMTPFVIKLFPTKVIP